MKILKFPELRQIHSWDCGASVTKSILAYYDIDAQEEAIIKLAGTNKNGTPLSGIRAVVKKYNLNFKAGKITIKDIKKFLDKKIPVILLIQAWSDKKDINWEKDWSDGHYVVAIGYNSKKLYFEDPWTISRTILSYEEFRERWHADINGKKHINWGMAVFGKNE